MGAPLNLVASMMVGPSESTRYLPAVLRSLLTFCDGVTVVSEEGDECNLWMRSYGVNVERAEPGTFFRHEGRARQRLLDATLAQNPTAILSLDADEVVSDGQALREAARADLGNGAWAVGIEEAWIVDENAIYVRKDGGWGLQARSPLLYRVPERRDARWRIQDRQLACGREPIAVRQMAARATPVDATVFHLGWANEHERQARYQRYVDHDGGKFHSRAHLDSIMYPPRRIKLAQRSWPEALAPYKAELLERANRAEVAA